MKLQPIENFKGKKHVRLYGLNGRCLGALGMVDYISPRYSFFEHDDSELLSGWIDSKNPSNEPVEMEDAARIMMDNEPWFFDETSGQVGEWVISYARAAK